jgi:hypothetical protein
MASHLYTLATPGSGTLVSIPSGFKPVCYEVVSEISAGGMGNVYRAYALACFPLNVKAKLRDMTFKWGTRQMNIPATNRTARDGEFRRRAVQGWLNPQ